MGPGNWRYGVLVALVALVASFATLGNDFTQDDRPALLEDDRLHDPARWPRYWSEGYWSEKFGGDLYRPMSSTTMAVQWELGGGARFTYKAVSVTLYMAAAIAVYHLALLVLGPLTALVTALLFAAHPVHVEAVAVAVNQAEIVVCILLTLAVARYIADRRADRVGWKTRWILFATTLVGGLYKETAAVLAALVIAAEFTILLRLDRRWRDLVTITGLQVVAVAILGVLRYRVHGDNLSATFTAEAISGATMWERLVSMLGGVVPEWLRLLLWPANLQADYSPRVIMPANGWGTEQTVGLLIIGLVGWLAWRMRDRSPAFSFGVAWTAIAILPVSNVLVPTGIMLAERTLITPSVGAMIAVGALGALAVRAAGVTARRRLVRRLGLAVAAAVIVMGVSRSISRHGVWRNQLVLWRQTVIDAPFSYRARMAFGAQLISVGYVEQGEQQFREGIELWAGSSGPLFTLADRYRHKERCEEAVPLYEQALAIEEFAPGRAALVSCRAWLGDYRRARTEAIEGLRSGYYSGVFRQWVRSLDAAIRTNAPPRTVRFPADKSHLFAQATLQPGVLDRTRVAKGMYLPNDE